MSEGSMRELTKKVVQAGLVEKNTLELFKKWGMLDPDFDAEPIQDATQEQLLGLVDDIAKLLEEEGEVPEIRESDMELETLFEKQSVPVLAHIGGDKYVRTRVVFNRTGHAVFRKSVVDGEKGIDEIDLAARPGMHFCQDHDVQDQYSEPAKFEILSVEPRFSGKDPVYLVCEVHYHPPKV
jgi:hypothetical protein